MIILMKTARLFMILLIGAVILFSGCNNDDNPVTYTVTVTNDANGTAEADKATAEAGTIVKLTATAADGYIFEKWTVESGDITLSPDATTNPATFTMPANAVSVKAEFTVQKTYSIYLAGAYQNGNYNTFGYTSVNGVQTDLPAPAGGINAQPNSMTVFGGKTYVAGGYFDSDGMARACYWIDGTVTKLDGPADRDSDQPDYVRSITVSDGKVYAAGSYRNNSNDFPCYWVDGAFNALALPSGTSSGATYAIAVSGSKVYAAGYSYDSAIIPGYWNDGVFVSLDIPAGAALMVLNGMGMGIAVSDKVYVMGNYILNDVNYPCVWADGVRTDLTFDNSANGVALGTSLAVSGGKVYVLGAFITDVFNKACYWVDGTRTDLKIPADTYSRGASIGVIDGKVYVGGRYYDSPFTLKPCYWFGDERTDLDIPTGGIQASITGMYVSK